MKQDAKKATLDHKKQNIQSPWPLLLFAAISSSYPSTIGLLILFMWQPSWRCGGAGTIHYTIQSQKLGFRLNKLCPMGYQMASSSIPYRILFFCRKIQCKCLSKHLAQCSSHQFCFAGLTRLGGCSCCLFASLCYQLDRWILVSLDQIVFVAMAFFLGHCIA